MSTINRIATFVAVTAAAVLVLVGSYTIAKTMPGIVTWILFAGAVAVLGKSAYDRAVADRGETSRPETRTV